MKTRDFSRSLVGVGAGVRSKLIRLRDLARIAQVERMLEAGPQVAWTAEFEAKRDETSRALFGITEADTRPKEPHPDDVPDPNGSRYTFSDAAFVNYGRALSAWYDWQTVMAGYEADVKEWGLIRLFRRMDVDVTDGWEEELRCLPFFARQIYVASKELLPGARLMPFGGPIGEAPKPVQSVEEWGAALAAEAARFRPSR